MTGKQQKRYTPGLADVEMTLEVLDKRKKKKAREAFLKSRKEGGKTNESNGKS